MVCNGKKLYNRDSLKFGNSKYTNDKYNRELYIPKGYILQTEENVN